MGRARSTRRENRNAYMILVGKSEVKRPQGRPRRRWEDNVKMMVERLDEVIWTGLICDTLGTRGVLL
jgi:hypothetical protein